MAYMQREQKYHPHSSPHHPNSPLSCLHHIDNTTQKLKMLLNSFRDRSLKDDDSFANESDFSKQDLMAQSRSFGMQRSRRRNNERLTQLYSIPKVGKDVGDIALATRPSRHAYQINEAQISRIIHKQPHQSPHQNRQTNDQHPKASPSNFQTTQQLSSKESELFCNPDKKMATFRITNRSQDKKKSTNGLSHNKSRFLNREQPFQVQSIDAYLIVSHLHAIADLQAESNPEEIFTFFESIHNIARFPAPQDPVIKRYRNCIYYGYKPNQNHGPYIGMVWYFKKTFYYGQFLDGKKHGEGVEIQVAKHPVVWKGKFLQGQKTGYFCVESNQFKYYGMLQGGKYHGEGHLVTVASEYKGAFCQGLKEGRGWEKMANKSEYKGEYFNNKFDGEGELKAQNYYYKGMFKCGKPDGRGFERTELYEYLGQFQMGVKQGKGKIKTKDGLTMECKFWNGLAVDDNLQLPKTKNVLEPHLSKRLGSLNEESEQGTIQHVLQAISKS